MTKQDIVNNIFSQDTLKNSHNISTYKDPTNDINNLNSNFSYASPLQYNKFIINSIPANGIKLSRSGTYTFAKDIYWNPARNQNAIAITICGNNIKLDMRSYKLICKNPNPNPNIVIGLRIIGQELHPISNVIIKNGNIVAMSYCGIQIIYCRTLHLNNLVIDGLGLNNLNIRNLTPSGIFLQYVTNFKVSNCTVKNIDVKTDSCAGIQIIESINGTISSCRMKKFINNDGAVQGFSYIGCENITTLKSKSHDLRSYFNGNILTSGHTVLGFCPIFCSKLLYKNCSASNLIGSCDDVHGISVFLNSNVELKYFNVENIIDGQTPSKSGAKSTGIEVYGCFVSVSDCTVNNVSAICPQDKQCSGFASAGYKIQYSNCRASNIQVLNKNSVPDVEYGFGVGFGWAPDPRPEFRIITGTCVTYKNCTATKCQVGFDTWFHINSKWNHTTSICCEIPFKNNRKEIRTLSCNACSECIPSIVITLGNLATGNKFSHVEYKNCSNNKSLNKF
jgi:hypothetical protein